MFSIADMAVAGAVALLLFGPDQLPKVARRAGQLVRDVLNTSQSFIREMERAADVHETIDAAPLAPSVANDVTAAPSYHESPDPAPHDLVAREAALDPRRAAPEHAASDPLPAASEHPLPDPVRSPPGQAAP
jgi:sec-independent protein translocase protein TatB